MNTNFKVVDSTGLGIKPKSSAPQATALFNPPFELLKSNHGCQTLIETDDKSFDF